jgi:hypothetical protein
LAGGLADAFGTTFWVAFALVAIALVPALLLPKRVQVADEVEALSGQEERKAA